MARVSLKEYHLWLGDFVTRVVRSLLKAKVDHFKEEWASGRWRLDPLEDAYARGYIAGLLELEILDSYFEEGGE